MPRTPSGTPATAIPAIAAPARSPTSMIGASSSATMRVAWPAVPPSRRIVASSAATLGRGHRGGVDQRQRGEQHPRGRPPATRPTPGRCSRPAACRDTPSGSPPARPDASRRTRRASAGPPAPPGDEDRVVGRSRRVARGRGPSRAPRRPAPMSGRRRRRRAAPRGAGVGHPRVQGVTDFELSLGRDHVAHGDRPGRGRRSGCPWVTRRSSAAIGAGRPSPAAGQGVSQPSPLLEQEDLGPAAWPRQRRPRQTGALPRGAGG